MKLEVGKIIRLKLRIFYSYKKKFFYSLFKPTVYTWRHSGTVVTYPIYYSRYSL